MASFALPIDAEPLLAFCARDLNCKDEMLVFDTYAHLAVFCASYGFHLHGTTPPPLATTFVKKPLPIEHHVFDGSDLKEPLFLIALAATGSDSVARDLDKVMQINQNYCAIGARELSKRLDASTKEEFPFVIAQLVSDAATAARK